MYELLFQRVQTNCGCLSMHVDRSWLSLGKQDHWERTALLLRDNLERKKEKPSKRCNNGLCSYLLLNGKGHGLVHNPLSANSLAQHVIAYKYSRRFHISALLGKWESVGQFIKEEVAQCNTSEVNLGCCNGQPRRGRSGGYFIRFCSLVIGPGQLHQQQFTPKLRGSPDWGPKMATPCK